MVVKKHIQQRHGAIGKDMAITYMSGPPDAQTWVRGTIHGHRFEALVFPEHAKEPWCELGVSRISKLSIVRLADEKQVYHFDRGMDLPPADTVTRLILEFLVTHLANRIFPRTRFRRN